MMAMHAVKSGNTSQQRRLEALLQLPENRECFDCGTRQPRWASTNLGIFICLRCAGVHRSLGTHITKVRSTNMDTWEEWMIRNCEAIGNKHARDLYEYNMPQGARATSSSDSFVLERTIKAKYEQKQYYNPRCASMMVEYLSHGAVTSLPATAAKPLITTVTPALGVPTATRTTLAPSQAPARSGSQGDWSNFTASVVAKPPASTTTTSAPVVAKPQAPLDDLWTTPTAAPPPVSGGSTQSSAIGGGAPRSGIDIHELFSGPLAATAAARAPPVPGMYAGSAPTYNGYGNASPPIPSAGYSQGAGTGAVWGSNMQAHAPPSNGGGVGGFYGYPQNTAMPQTSPAPYPTPSRTGTAPDLKSDILATFSQADAQHRQNYSAWEPMKNNHF